MNSDEVYMKMKNEEEETRFFVVFFCWFGLVYCIVLDFLRNLFGEPGRPILFCVVGCS